MSFWSKRKQMPLYQKDNIRQRNVWEREKSLFDDVDSDRKVELIHM